MYAESYLLYVRGLFGLFYICKRSGCTTDKTVLIIYAGVAICRQIRCNRNQEEVSLLPN